MDMKETKKLLEFSDKHCINGCEGCIGNTEGPCSHPDHPLLDEGDKQNINISKESANVSKSQ